MTAEVAIINPNAVALAADSAVTIGSQKIYNSALKVFSLSKTSPVGIMIYGNASLLEVPWETIIKVYRAQLGKKTFETLEKYADDFFSYLKKQNNFFPIDAQEKWAKSNINSYLEQISR